MQRRTFMTGVAATIALPMAARSSCPAARCASSSASRPGGGTDILARVIGQKLADDVEHAGHRGEQGRRLRHHRRRLRGQAARRRHRAAHGAHQQPRDRPNLQKLGYDAEKDFQPIALVGVTPNLLICGQMQPAKTVKDLVALCKANPGKVSFGSAGPGSAQHLALEMFMLQAGVKAIHVPYKGSGPMLTDLIGGQVQYSFDTMTAATPHVKNGKAIAIAQTRQKRAAGHPQRADDGRVRLPRLRGHHLVRPGRPRQDVAGAGQAHERGREQGAGDARRDGEAGSFRRRGRRRLHREVRASSCTSNWPSGPR